jgi:putative FmdB family regulatory protein
MTYDYVCTACSHVWEAEQRITEEPLKDCPHCHQVTAKRQISGGQGFILKGGGWYSDLYSSAKPAAAADSAKESKPVEAAGAKPESKPDSKSESKPEKAASPSASAPSNSPAASSAS